MPYLPTHDTVTDRSELLALVRAHPLATVVTHDGPYPDADLVPLLADVAPDDSVELIGHVARANPVWRDPVSRGPVLALFGPVHHYVSPTWYPSTALTQRTVPTWVYLVVHARGELVVHDDPRWCRTAVARLTAAMEAGRERPWRMGQAPADYVDSMLADIVGISVRVTSLVGKYKVAAHRSEADRIGARDGIGGEGHGGHAALLEAMTQPPQGTAF